MYEYAIRIHNEPGGIWASCRDIPEFHSAGDTLDHAKSEAVDGMISALSIYIDQRREIPPSTSERPGECTVRLPALVQAKVILWNEMCERGWRKADLTRAMGVKPVAVDRLLDLMHSSKMDQLESALVALDRSLSLSVA